MPTEFEAKFIDIDKHAMRKKLEAIGATLVHKKMKYTRIVFNRCDNEIRGYARIRNEGEKVTMTVKLYKDPKFPEEYEIEIKDGFEKGVAFLKSLGLSQKAFQETFREKWTHPLAHELTFDDIPGIPTYMEVDCTSENNLNELINMLELDKKNMRFGAYDLQYEEYYGIPKNVLNNETPSLTFKNIKNEIKPTKNHDLLDKVVAQYTDSFLARGKGKKSKKSKKTKKTKKDKKTKKSKRNT
jgi:adenylate cyclase class 2